MSIRTALRPRTPARGRRLRVEPLEGREVPAGYFQTNLASDIEGQAQKHDTDLVDAWGISLNPNGTFWVSGRETDVSTVYTGDVNGGPFVESALIVTIPGGRPTGQVFNGTTTDFLVSDGTTTARATFIFASETGNITGWNAGVAGPPTPSRTAVLKVSTPGAVYTGLAIHTNPGNSLLYAADFAGGKIDVFDRTWAPTTLAGSFVDPAVPADYDPFNIWKIGDKLYVAYAQQLDGDALPDGGHGYISVFDTSGNLLSHLVEDSHLKEPWGMAIAPANFGEFSNALLVANTHNGKINAYDPATGTFLGRLADPTGETIHIPGLWALHFGNGTVSGDANALYFTAAVNHEHGLFGSLRVSPDAPAALRAVSSLGTESDGKTVAEPGLVSGQTGMDDPDDDADVLAAPAPESTVSAEEAAPVSPAGASVPTGVPTAPDDSPSPDPVAGDLRDLEL